MDPNEQMLKSITELLTLACLNEDASSSYYISKLINERTEGAIHIPTAIIIPSFTTSWKAGESAKHQRSSTAGTVSATRSHPRGKSGWQS